MKFQGKVTQEFIRIRDQKVKEDFRPDSVALRQWDFEFVEYHQSSIPSTGHKLYEGYEYDTTHYFFGNCDFKHVNKKNEFHISPYILKQIKNGLIDHIVLWRFIQHPGKWKRSLQENDVVQYEILDYVSSSEILEALTRDRVVKGFTVHL